MQGNSLFPFFLKHYNKYRNTVSGCHSQAKSDPAEYHIIDEGRKGTREYGWHRDPASIAGSFLVVFGVCMI